MATRKAESLLGRLAPQSRTSSQVETSLQRTPACLSRSGPLLSAKRSKADLSGHCWTIIHSSGCLRLRCTQTLLQPADSRSARRLRKVSMNLSQSSPRVLNTTVMAAPPLSSLSPDRHLAGREFGSDLVARLLDHPQLGLGLFDRSRLEAAVRIDVDLLRLQVLEGPVNVLLYLFQRLDPVCVHVDHAEADVLGERMLPEPLQQVQPAVGHLEVDLVDWNLEKPGIDLLEPPVAHVCGRVSFETIRHDSHRLDRHFELVQPRRNRRLVDLDVAGAGPLKVSRLLMHDFSQRHHEVPAAAEMVVERPVANGVRPGQHAFDRPFGQALGELPPLDSDRMRAADGADGDWLFVVAVAVRADEARDAHALQVLGEVRDHVAAIHLAVDADVDADLVPEL